ncbi:hypothetical protein MJO29_009145 [Puccinia striiformis f. sp. tritici]|uniref:hypothetical protein n=1 Tax=Puccinia striiformis f. sp. tritici TaxID=168172 RepID=UPI0020078600|nr:hypothetical protein Pst134EA_017945 [Puccinia striiformis f. sp. tritici]KAH9461652.1 hypothetical protein Pst134EA_017945 [Puccinia striiformis f. sp. tritici]KAI7950471.1 hypothetical protein MJO29_009145 [Puccinia striiformis f. sp. tritici]
MTTTMTADRQLKRIRMEGDSRPTTSQALTIRNPRNNPSVDGVKRPDPPLPIRDYFDYCHISDDMVEKYLVPFCEAEYIDRYELINDFEVKYKYTGSDYAWPSGLIAIIKNNVDGYKKYLQALKDRQ